MFFDKISGRTVQCCSFRCHSEIFVDTRKICLSSCCKENKNVKCCCITKLLSYYDTIFTVSIFTPKFLAMFVLKFERPLHNLGPVVQS